MELFDKNGCLTDEGLQALQAGGLDELGRLETAEHLSYCDKCMDRYTALLTADALETPPHSAHKAVMATIWVRLMQNTWGRAAVAGVAAVLAFTMWRSGTIGPAAEFPAGAAHMDTGDQPESDRRSLAAGQAGGRWPTVRPAGNTGKANGRRQAEAAGFAGKSTQ